MRSETHIAMHEIVETVDRLLGHGTCAAGGSCRARGICKDSCDNIVSLQCPGAPTSSWTGCDDRQLDGWVVQKLGYAGRDLAQCESCIECDFTPRVCTPDEPDCTDGSPR
jgi:hypothetical protein